jgi:hypothetical protein
MRYAAKVGMRKPTGPPPTWEQRDLGDISSSARWDIENAQRRIVDMWSWWIPGRGQ